MQIWFDRQGQPIDAARANDLLGDTDYVRVALTDVTSATDAAISYRISTVWLGANYAFLDGPPILFETMVFGGSEDQDQSMWRWGTEEQAKAGHAEIVTTVAATVPDAVIADLPGWPHPVNLIKESQS